MPLVDHDHNRRKAQVTIMTFDNKDLASALFGDLGDVEPGAKVPCKCCGKCLRSLEVATLRSFGHD